jgi:CubicO group peptidase (beta-lactamase class C family)
MYKYLYSLLLLTYTVGAYSQNSQTEKQLDEMLARQFKSNTPGCAILVAKKGQVIYKKAFGSANLELNVPMQADMVFKIASVTKQFTAVAILKLVEQGKIGLQDSLQKYIPDFPSKGHTITIEHLLTHTSGIRDYMQIDFRGINMERWDYTPKQLIDSFKHYALAFEPGTKFSYSNSGYYLLGYIIEKVSGKPYQRYIEDNLLTPLGLTHSFFDLGNNLIPNRVNGYRQESTAYINADFWSPSLAYAAGGLLSNTEDLYNWFKGLLSYKIIKKESLEKAFTPFTLKDGSPLTYGYGLYIQHMSSIKSIEHSGKMNGFTSNAIYYPQQDVYLAVLFNCGNAPKDEISKEVSEIVLGQALQTGTKQSDKTLNAYIGTYNLTTDPRRTIEVSKEGNGLVAKVSGQQTFEILFQSSTKFQLKNIKDMTGEFIIENGIVTKMMMSQNGLFEWKKTK